MTTATLAIEYASTTVNDPWWVRFGQDGINDTATVGETADLLDVLYTIDPCDGSESETSTPVADDVVEAVVQTFRLSICDKRYDGSVLVPIKMYRSHPSDAYALRVSGGRVEGEIIAELEEVSQTVTVKQASSLTLEYPVVSGFAARWVGDVVDSDGNPVSAPTIKRQGNTLYWQGQVTGTVRSEFVSTYDRVDILVAGVGGEMGQAVVRAFYHGTCTTFTPEMPDAAESDTSLCPSTTWQVDPDPDNVTCYEIVVQTKRCGCSGIEKESQTFERDVPCPASGPTRCPGVSHTCRHLLGTVADEVFVECEEDRGYLVAEREFYKEQCCEYPSLSLPQCEEKTESYTGDKSIEHGEAFWRGLYGEHTRFVPISPEDGCGKHITRQVIEPDDCCETAPPLTWDSDNSIDTVHDFDSGFVYVRDGIGPFVWEIIGSGYLWFSGAPVPVRIVTDERWAAIETGAYPCGKFKVEVTDSCGTVVSGEIVSTYGEWVERAAPTGGNWWTLDQAIEDGLAVPISTPQSVTFIDDPYGWAAQSLMQVVKDFGDGPVRFEQYVGFIPFDIEFVAEGGSTYQAVYLCKPVADPPPVNPADFPFPTTIPTTVRPTAPGYNYYLASGGGEVPWAGDNDAGIWSDGANAYEPKSRRTLHAMSALEFLTAIGETPGANPHAPAGEDELLWGYSVSVGSAAGCCEAGETCYRGWFGYLAYSQSIRIFDWSC